MKHAVYFIKNSEGQVKIGTSKNVLARLAFLQTATHLTLTLLGVVPGSKIREREIQQQFRDLHERGEWFRPSPELIEWIARMSVPLESLGQISVRSKDDPQIVYACELVKRLAAPVFATDTRVAMIARARSRLPVRWSRNRVRSIWHRDSRIRLTFQDMQELEAAVAAHEKRQNTSERDLISQLIERVALLEVQVAQLQVGAVGSDVGPRLDLLRDAHRHIGRPHTAKT